MVSYHLIATKRHWYPEKVQVRWACEAFRWLHPSLQFSRGKILLKILNNQTVIERNQKKKKKKKWSWGGFWSVPGPAPSLYGWRSWVLEGMWLLSVELDGWRLESGHLISGGEFFSTTPCCPEAYFKLTLIFCRRFCYQTTSRVIWL